MELYRREKYLSKIRGFYHAEDIIKVITGVRRCGKSCLMATIVEELAEQGIDKSQITFIDLDERKNRKVTTPDQLEALIDQTPTTPGKTQYLFIDEVQNVEGFEPLINGYRTDGGYSIFLTGSNSYLLSGELATKLTGRYVEVEIFTLTFDEYEGMKRHYGLSVAPDRATELSAYILEGGFPRALFFETLQDKRTYVQGVVDEIFQKDIKKRVKVRDVAAFESVRRFIINNFGATFSINSLHQALRAAGMNIGRATVTRYIKHLVDAKVLYECDRFDMKSKRSLSGEKKYYLADLGIYFAQNTDNQINYGPVLENMVYLYARSFNYAVSVGRIGKLECDFVLRDSNMGYAYVQVAYTILASEETEDREYRALESIRDNYAKYVLTTDTLLQQRNGIIHANILDFMEQQSRF